MRLLLTGLLLTAASLGAADPGTGAAAAQAQPAAAPAPQAPQRAAVAVAASPAAYASPVATPYPASPSGPQGGPSAVATADPTPRPSVYKPYVAPTPTPGPATDDGLSHVTTAGAFHPDYGIQVRGGGSMPLGSLASDNSSGGVGGLDLLVTVAPKVRLGLQGLWADMPYTQQGGSVATPMSVYGVDAKVDYEVFRVEQLSAWLGVGAGYFGCSRTELIPKAHDSDYNYADVTAYNEVPQTVGGVGLVFCAGTGYEFDRHWSLNGEVDILSLSLSGGTSDSLLAALPNLTLKWMY